MTPVDKAATRHVYVIGTLSGPFKIGVATNLRNRLSSIQTGSHLKVSAAHSVVVPASHAYAVEAHAHKLLKNVRLSGEWFNVSLVDAKSAVTQAISLVEDRDNRREKDRERRLKQKEADQRQALELAKRDEERRKSDPILLRQRADLMADIEAWLLELSPVASNPVDLSVVTDLLRVAEEAAQLSGKPLPARLHGLVDQQIRAARGMPQIPYRPRAPIHNGSTEPSPDLVDGTPAP